MKTLCKVIVGIFAVVCLAGCGDDQQKATDANGGKPAEAATQPNGGAPVAEAQQTMAVGQVVEQAASQGDSKAGRRAMDSIDKINAQKKGDE
jgi:uncharacterized lipoprotein